MPTFGTPITNQHSVSPCKMLTKDKTKTQLGKNKHIWQTRNLMFNKKLDNEQELDSFVA